MKNLILKELHLENFQKFKSQTFEFGERVTNVHAPNRGGKTTMYSAMTWLLFGKDCFGRTDTGRGAFDVKRLEAGRKLDHVDVLVSGVFLLDGSHIEFKRVLQEQWTKGKDSHYKGDETKCFINDVPKTITEYNSEVYSIICEEEFRMITNIGHFLSLKTEFQRNYLCAMAGVRGVDDICKDNPEWMEFIKSISGKSLEDARKQLSFQKSELEKRYDKIGPAIEALQKTKPESLDWNQLEFEKEGLQSLIDEANESLTNAGKQDEVKAKEISELRLQSSKYRESFFSLTNKAREERQRLVVIEKEKLNQKDSKRTEIVQKIDKLKKDKSESEIYLPSLEAKFARLSEEAKKLLDEYYKNQNSLFESSEEATICPLFINHKCNSPDLLEYMENNRKNAEEKFNVEKVKKEGLIKAEGSAKVAEKEQCAKSITEHKEKIASLTNEIVATETVLNSMPANANTPINELELTSPELELLNQQKIEANANISSIDEQIKKKESEDKVDNSELLAKRQELNKQKDVVVGKLSIKSQIEKIEVDISEYEKQGKDIAAQITDIENKEFLGKEINREVVQDATDRVNEMFSFVKWQMFELQKNGIYAEVCKPTIEGASQSLNTESMVNVGIDIVNTISRFRGVSAPLFIDNHESVNNTIPVVGQSINLFVAPQNTELTIKIIE